MSANGHCFVEWKEEYVSQERGNRIVHYLLKDSGGESVLAVIGTERSLRHMFYVVADEFLQVCGEDDTIHAGFKWRSRREVVDWLTSMLSKQRLPGELFKSHIDDSTQAVGCSMTPESGSGARSAYIADCTGRLGRNLKGHRSDIVWSGVSWTCGKQLKHYPSFCRNGTMISIQSFVFIMAKEDDRYLAYLEDLYEDRKGQKKVKVRWFHHNQEVKGVVPLRNLHPQEVFITPYSQVISVECVDGLAVVLTPGHYEKCVAIFPPSLLGRVHLCFRQFKSNRVKPFDLSKMRGYFDQKIFSCLDPHSFLKHSVLNGLADDDEEEEFSPWDNVKKGSKRTRSCRGRQRILTEGSIGRISGQGRQMSTTYDMPYRNSKHISSRQKSYFLTNMKPSLWYTTCFEVDEKVEVLCQDSGIRGCWFRCKVLQVSRKQLKVQYDDVQDEDGGGNLEEWIPAFRPAAPDKLGMRCLDRPTLRPAPSINQLELDLQVGSPIDAWWSDGWWEGVITGGMNNEDDTVQVYFPGENLHMGIYKKNLRISRDWVGDQWVDIEAKPDIFSVVAATASTNTKLSMPSTAVKDAQIDGFAMSYEEIPLNTNIMEEKGDMTPLSISHNRPKDMDCENEKEHSPSMLKVNGDYNECRDTDHAVVAQSQGACGENGDGGNGVNAEGKKKGCYDDDYPVFDKDTNCSKSQVEFDTAVQNSEAVDLMEVAA